MKSPWSLRTCRHTRSQSLPTVLNAKRRSSFLQSTTKPDFHTSSAASVAHGSPSAGSTIPSSLASPLAKTSYVQQMWFHEGDRKISKEELSKNIAAMIEGENPQEGSLHALENQPQITLLVGEVVFSIPHPQIANVQLNSIRLSNVCTPRTILTARESTNATKLIGRKVIVVLNLPHGPCRDPVSASAILCSGGKVLSPINETRIGSRLYPMKSSEVLPNFDCQEIGLANMSGKLHTLSGDEVSLTAIH